MTAKRITVWVLIGLLAFEFGVAGASKLTLQWANGTANWQYKIDGGAATNTGVNWGTSYQVLSIRRVSNTAYFYIDGTQVHSAAYATDLTGGYVYLNTQGTAATDIRFDYAKLWVNRA